MKLYLLFALLLLGTSASKVRFTPSELLQVTQQPDVDGYLNQKMFKLLSTKITPAYIDPVPAVASLFQYYLDGNLFTNTVHALFAQVDSSADSLIEKNEYYDALQSEGIHKSDAKRIWNLVTAENSLQFAEFQTLSEILYHEALAVTTFVFITGSAEHARNVGVSLDQLEKSLTLIFSNLDGGYPLPRCQELAYLFNQCNIDGDNVLNVEELFYALSIFLKFYRAGVENNLYGSVVLNDNLFELLWRKEDKQAQHRKKLEVFHDLFHEFFALVVDEKNLGQVTNQIFDELDVSGNHELDFDEFKQGLANFGATDKDALLLYANGDTDSDGSLNYGEFAILFETFIRKAAAKFGFYYLHELGHDINLPLTYTLFYDVVHDNNLKPVSDSAYRALFAAADSDDSGLIDLDEFSKLTSAIISSLKNAQRDKINQEIEVIAGTAASNQNINDALNQKEEAAEVTY